MKFKKGLSFVLTLCMVLSLFATFVIPVAAAELPEGAVAIDYLGYIHDSYSMVAYAEADMTLGALVNKYLGQVKDLNYCKVAVCNEDGTVTAVYLTLGREPAEGPNGIKTDLTIAAGQFAVIYNANKTGHEVMDDISVGDIVTLYNVDALKTHTGTAVALEGAGFTVKAAPVTSKVVTDWNPVSYKESVGGATGAFIYDDADIYANCANYWWIHAAFAPSATVEGGYEVVALRPSSGETVPFLTIPEGGFVWMAWSSAGDTPESSGAYALAFMSELAVGDVVFFKGVDFANKTTAADATAELWVDPNAPVNVALNKDYTLSGEENATYNAKLTDGNAYGAMTYDNRWFAFTGANTVDKIGTVVVDLGALYDITAIQVNLVNDTGAGVAVPEYANLYVSEDGETWSEAIALTVSDANQVAYWAKAEELAVSAQYVKFEVKLGGTFAFLNEIEVYGALPAEPEYNEVVVDVNTNAILTDGKSDFTGDWGAVGGSDVLLITNGECKNMAMKVVVNYALGETKSIDALTLDFYHCAGVMIGYPEGKILVEVSVDGETYTEVGQFDIATAEVAVGQHTTVSTVCKFDAVDAAYVRATFVAGSSTGVLGDSPADGKVFWEFVSLAEVAVSEFVPVTSQVVTDWNVSDWSTSANGANGAYLFTDQDAYLACTHTWWSHISFKPTTIAGVYEVAAIRGATGEAASFEIAEGGFVLAAHDTAAAGTAGAYVHALIKSLEVGDRVIFNGLNIADLTTTADATAVLVPTAEDMDLLVSHNYNYNWHCFEGQIITMAVGEANLKKAGDAPNMSAEDTDILYIVELVNGAYLVTGVVGGKALLDVEIPENGFLYYVTKNCTGYDKICHGELVGKYLVLGDIDLATKFAIDTQKGNPAYVMKAVSSFKTGDADLDGKITATDYAIVRQLVLGTLTAEDVGELAYKAADVNGNGKVDARDYYLVKRAFLGTYVIPGWEQDDAE